MAKSKNIKMLWLGAGKAIVIIDKYTHYPPALLSLDENKLSLAGEEIELHKMVNRLKNSEIDITADQLLSFLQHGYCFNTK